VGVISTGNLEGEDGIDGFFAFMEEIALQLGIPVNRWFMSTKFFGSTALRSMRPSHVS
jgi:hypothetical protein